MCTEVRNCQEKGESEWLEATEKEDCGRDREPAEQSPKTSADEEMWTGRFWMGKGGQPPSVTETQSGEQEIISIRVNSTP